MLQPRFPAWIRRPASPASEMWHKPSTPSAISTNRPNCAVRSTFAMNLVAHAVGSEETLPHVGLQLLDAQAQAAVLPAPRPERLPFTFSPFFTISEGCFTRLSSQLDVTRPSIL